MTVPRATGRPGNAGRAIALATVCAALFLTMLDSTIVSVTLPSMQQTLHIGVTGLEWVVSSYVLVFAAFMLTGGTLGDLFGRRLLLLVGLGLFAAGSVVSAVATAVPVLYAGRIIQGIGAAASEPGTLSILRQLYPDEAERARAIGLWAGVSGLALALGPVIGGLLVAAGDWRNVFWFNLAFAVVTILASARFVPESAHREGRHIDLAGQLTGAAALGLLTYALIRGQDIGFSNPEILGCFAISAVAGAAFVRVERRSSSPALQLSFFRRATFTGANVVAFAVNFGVFAIFLFLSLFLQLVAGMSALHTAAHFVPMTVAMIVAAPLTGRWVARAGPRVPLTVGLLVAGTGMLLTNNVLGPHVTFGQLSYALPILGVGLGMVLAPVTSAVMSSVPGARSGMAAATTNVSRQIGAVVGVAVLGAIVNAELTGSLVDKLRALGVPLSFQQIALTAVQKGIIQLPTTAQLGGQSLLKLEAEALAAGKQAFDDGLHLALLTSAIILFAAAVVGWICVRGGSRTVAIANEIPQDVARG